MNIITQNWISSIIVLLGLTQATAQPLVPTEGEPPAPNPNRYANVLDASELGKIPTMIDGRIMPLDTRARSLLLLLSGVSTWKYEVPDPKRPGEMKKKRRPAIDWLARVLMEPASTRDDKVFLINNPELAEALGVTHDGGRTRFSFSELEPSISKVMEIVRGAGEKEKQGKPLRPLDREARQLSAALQLYLDYTVAMMFAIDHHHLSFRYTSNKEYLGLPDQPRYSFMDLYERGAKIHERMPKPGDTSEPSPEDAELLSMAQTMYTWTTDFQHIQFGIIPVKAHSELVWFNPWSATTFPPAATQIRSDLGLLATVLERYVDGNQAGFNSAVQAYHNRVNERVGTGSPLLAKAREEVRYNRFKPFYKAKILYGLTLLLALLLVANRSKKMWLVPFVLCLMAWVLQTWGIGQRMYIMGRPPITNLYATFLFVSWASVLIGLLIEFVSRRGMGSLANGIFGLVLLLVSGKFAAQEGDTMATLVAVLDSNFWLATHVIAINLGYVGVAFAGVFGMIYLYVRLFNRKNQDLKLLQSCIYGVMAFGLLFSFLGTFLGGVWADQSWGRFWGWDPKENGALLVVIWAAIVFHARMSGMLRETGTAVTAALGMIVVLFAWLGVNLLGVGLHSYGFTSGVETAMNLTILGILLYCLVTGGIIWLRDQGGTRSA